MCIIEVLDGPLDLMMKKKPLLVVSSVVNTFQGCRPDVSVSSYVAVACHYVTTIGGVRCFFLLVVLVVDV